MLEMIANFANLIVSQLCSRLESSKTTRMAFVALIISLGDSSITRPNPSGNYVGDVIGCYSVVVRYVDSAFATSYSPNDFPGNLTSDFRGWVPFSDDRIPEHFYRMPNVFEWSYPFQIGNSIVMLDAVDVVDLMVASGPGSDERVSNQVMNEYALPSLAPIIRQHLSIPTKIRSLQYVSANLPVSGRLPRDASNSALVRNFVITLVSDSGSPSLAHDDSSSVSHFSSLAHA